MTIIYIMAMMIVVSALSSTVMLVLMKYDVFEKYQLYRKLWMPDVCMLCIGFWICVCITITILLLSKEQFNILYLSIPVGAASLTRLISK